MGALETHGPCARKASLTRTGVRFTSECLYLLIENVIVCGEVTPVILHGIVSPEILRVAVQIHPMP